MRTIEQQNASRANGAKSHGPTTPEGKERSSQNAITHGLFSDAILLRPDSREQWQKTERDYITRFKPADNIELGVIHDMAVANWRARRADAMEAALINLEIDRLIDVGPATSTPDDEICRAAIAYACAAGKHEAMFELGRQSARLHRLWMRLHSKLKELQKDRKAEEAELAAAHGAEPPAAPPPESTRENSQDEPEPAQLPARQPVAPAAHPAALTPLPRVPDAA